MHEQQKTTYTVSPGIAAVARARRKSDVVVLVITFVVLFLLASLYFIIATLVSDNYRYSTDETEQLGMIFSAFWGGAILFLIILLIGMFLIRMQRQTMLGNALMVQYCGYDWLREWSEKVTNDFAMPKTEIFVTQDPVLNAYAYGFVRPYNIVLHSSVFDKLSHDELRAIIVHEIAHIKYSHTNANLYLMPFTAVPVVGVITSWVAGFWSRRAELTADRLALSYLGNVEKIKTALIKVHAGAEVEKYMNDIARQWLQHVADRPMNRLAQTFSSHPFLVRRLSQLDDWNKLFYPETKPQVDHELAPKPKS